MLMGVAVATVLGAASCKKSVIPAAKGDSVLFSAGIGVSESGTKTAYAGDNASDRTLAENINWLSGDQIRIWCAECSEPTAEGYGGMDHCADYTVTPESTATQGKIAVNPGTVGLRWGEAGTEHWFYSLYPSPKATDRGDEGKFGTASAGIKTPFSFTGHIPASQAITGYTPAQEGKDEKGNPLPAIASPDMRNLYMASQGISAKPESSGSGVFLTFRPLTTAIEFTITNGMTADDAKMYVENVSLVSENHNLCGAFEVAVSNEWGVPSSKYRESHPTGVIYTYNHSYPVCTEPFDKSGQGNAVAIDFAGTNACTEGIAKGKTLRFTFFLLPLTPNSTAGVDDVDDLYFVIRRKDGEGYKTLKTKLEMADHKPVPFPVHKKTYVTGILVPDSASWTITYSLDVTPWDQTHGEGVDFYYPDASQIVAVTPWTDVSQDPGFLYFPGASQDAGVENWEDVGKDEGFQPEG